LVLAACILEVILSGRSINRAAATAHDWIYIGGLLFSIWIVGALAFRTTFIKERLLFVFASFALVLHAVIAVMLPSQPIVHVLRWIILLMWPVLPLAEWQFFPGERLQCSRIASNRRKESTHGGEKSNRNGCDASVSHRRHNRSVYFSFAHARQQTP
jgi:hypothetical protein